MGNASSVRDSFISLGETLADEKNKAYNLWTQLPSYRAAINSHGDNASDKMPSVADAISESSLYISHRLSPTEEEIAEAGDLYECPCGCGASAFETDK